ncbi:flagellar basal body-associated FliL family protein [Egicoccus sp. AB-alg6-2]|uniref:flagellar basal body-associated FliL family protein n=1 Tax=Egicoccus sp. AB-alg6-2 TaxID=3242692 RepID=UPI00359D90DC
MTTEIAPPTRRIRAVVAVSIVVSLVCIGWWGVQLQWFAREADVSEHVVTFEPQVVTLVDGTHASIALAALVIGEQAVAPVSEATDLLRAKLVEVALEYDAERMRSGDGQNELRGQLLRELRDLAPGTRIDRVLLTHVLVQ